MKADGEAMMYPETPVAAAHGDRKWLSRVLRAAVDVRQRTALADKRFYRLLTDDAGGSVSTSHDLSHRPVDPLLAARSSRTR